MLTLGGKIFCFMISFSPKTHEVICTYLLLFIIEEGASVNMEDVNPATKSSLLDSDE